MYLYDIANLLEELAPRALAEDFDNVGILVGSPTQIIHKALICLDCTETIIDEAIASQANLIITFHPIIFKGLKSLTGSTYVERVVIKAIQHKIAIYAIHTNLDFTPMGSNHKLASILGLQSIHPLIPKDKSIRKLTTFVPPMYADSLKEALFAAGAGRIGNYQECSFSFTGNGSFNGNPSTKPTIGTPGIRENVPEVCLNVTFPFYYQQAIIQALHKAHPYEEVAYEIYTLDNDYPQLGIGAYGYLPQPMDELTFFHCLKYRLKTSCIRHSARINRSIQKVALLGGSGSFGLSYAKKIQADAYISADFKYHDFFQAEGQLLICDVGHFESEQFIMPLLFDYLLKKNVTFAFTLSQINTNSVNYYL